MGGSRSRARRALLVLVVLAGVLPPPSAWVRAQPFVPESPEPPLAGPPPIAPGWPGAPAEPADPPTPVVSLHVRAPANAAAGQEVDYRILVENPSRAAAHHVRVRSTVPAAAAFVRASPEPTARDPQVVWELGTLPPGTSKEILLTLKPTEVGDVDVTARVQFEHGESVHTRVGAGAPSAPPAPTPPVAPTPPMPPAAPAPAPPAKVAALHLRKTGPTQALVGDFISFQLNVTNTGTADAVDVELDDSLPEGLELWSRSEKAPKGNRANWKIGRLPPGATATRDYDVLVKKVGEQENVAQATAEGGILGSASWKVRVDEPKLSVAIHGPEKGLLNRPAKYLITVTNAGAAPLTHVEVRAEIPAGVQLAGSPNHDGRQEGNLVHWLLGEAAPSQQATLIVELTAAKETAATVHVTARADRGVTDHAEANTRFEGAAGLRVEIDKTVDPVEVGHVVDYTVRVFNRGSAAAKNLQLTATLPDEMQPATPNDPNGPTLTGRTLTFPSLPALEAGKETIYTIRLRAVRAGAVKVVVELQSAELTTPLHEEETTTIYGEAASVAPAPTPDPPPAAPPALLPPALPGTPPPGGP